MTTIAGYQLQEVDVTTLKRWLDRREAVVIDVREVDEYLLEHIPGAQLIPLSNFNAYLLKEAYEHQRIVLQCYAGDRSAQAAYQMFQAGFTRVLFLQGGLPAWKAAGYATKVSRRVPLSMFRQVQIFAGLLVVFGVLLGVLVSPWLLLIPVLTGLCLINSGVTNTCSLALLLAKLPCNQRAVVSGEMVL